MAVDREDVIRLNHAVPTHDSPRSRRRTDFIVGLDGRKRVPWRRKVLERGVANTTRAAVARACADGVALAVAAVIGPSLSVFEAHL